MAVSVEISSARSLDDPRIFWLRVDDIHCINPASSFKEISQLKFKVKIYKLINGKKNVGKNLVAKLESSFIAKEDIKKHVFHIHTDKSVDTRKSIKDIMIQLKVRAKCGNQKEMLRLGHASVLLDNLDVNGNVFTEKKTLTDDKWNPLRNFNVLEKPIL